LNYGAVTLAALLTAALLAGCQAPVRMSNLIVSGAEELSEDPAAPLAVEVGQVGGGEVRGILNQIEITDLDLREAIINSLAVRGALARSQPDYRLDAQLVRATRGLQEILLGLDVTTTVMIRYRVTDAQSGAVVYAKTVSSSGQAASNEFFSPTERTQVATERAIRNNLRALLSDLYEVQRLQES
jgi:hypothetical protein